MVQRMDSGKPAYRENVIWNRKIYIGLVGNMGVGKTSLRKRFLTNIYTGKECSTLSVVLWDIKPKIITLGGDRYELYIIDTAGQERFSKTAQFCGYFKKSNAIAIVVSFEDEEWQESVRKWYFQIIHQGYDPEITPIFVVCNKSDLDTKNEWITSAEKFIRLNDGMKLKSPKTTSAKSGCNVHQTFTGIAELTSTQLKRKDIQIMMIEVPPSYQDRSGMQTCQC